MLDPRAVAEAYWAAHLNQSPGSLFDRPLRVVFHGDQLADYHGVFALFRGAAAIVSIPPARSRLLQPLLEELSSACSPTQLATTLAAVATAVIGPACISYALDVPEPSHGARALCEDDAPQLTNLQAACTAMEWEHGGSPAPYPCSGVFVGDQLAAVAGYEIWGKAIAHISIVTHPDFRGQGFGRSAVAHLAKRALQRGLLPQYRTLAANKASLRIGESLGFLPYATSMAVRLTSGT